MSVVHTDMPPPAPGHRGESDFARWLADLGDEKLHVWFGVDYLPGVSDIDVLACHTDIGFFVIEVKAVRLDAIERYGPAECHIRGRQNHVTPLQQARKAQLRLSEYLRNVGRIKRPPFIHVTAAWPRIARTAFLERWPQPTVQAQAGSMLFNEELQSREALEERLRSVAANPPMGAPSRPRVVDPHELQRLIPVLSPKSPRPPSQSDADRIRFIEQQLRDSVRERYPPGLDSPVLFLGAPGTGKTFRLLEIALAHAEAGRTVLFACYNKVLAADLRRLLHASEAFRAVADLVDIVDVEQLFRRFGSVGYGGYDESRAQAVDALRATQPELTFDTVLVDEAQDLKQWSFELAEWLAAPQADWFVAEGRGQSLYGDAPSPWLQEFGDRARKEHLRRVFRTARTDFLVAQALHEFSPDTTRAEAWLEQRLPRHPEEAQLSLELAEEFDRAGQPPLLINLRGTDSDSDPGWRDRVVAEYGRVIADELRKLDAVGSPGDLVVLVPGRHELRGEGRWAVQALSELNVPYVDQVDDEERRNLVPSGHVRVVTYHSARGIEAGRALVFGFEALETLGAENRQRNLGYIALSRARYGTTIALSPYRAGVHADFVQAVVAMFESRGDGDVP